MIFVYLIGGGLFAVAIASFPIWRAIRAELGGAVGWKKPNHGQHVVIYFMSMIWSAAVLMSALGIVVYMFRQTTLSLDSGFMALAPFYMLFFIVAGVISFAGRRWLRWLASSRKKNSSL